MVLETMLLRTMLASLCLSRVTAYSLCHQRLATEIAGRRISRRTRRYITNDDEERISVTGTVYSADNGAPIVTLFTKDGCTLCDKVKDVLVSLKTELPHSLSAVDITDAEHEMWFSKYKYDIPILHIDGQYWTKHRLDEDEARDGLQLAIQGDFLPRDGEPDAGEMERRQ